MILKCPDDIEYACDKAVKNERDFTIKAYLDNEEILTIYAVVDFSEYTLEDGEWSYPDPTPEEQLRADMDYCMMILGEE